MAFSKKVYVVIAISGILFIYIPHVFAQLTFSEATHGNATLGKEIMTNPDRLHQFNLDTNKYNTDHKQGIETQDDLRILHDMCSVALFETNTNPIIGKVLTPSECINP